jgi:hypothetical protein
MGIAFFFMLRNWLGAVNNLSDYQVRCARVGCSLCIMLGTHEDRLLLYCHVRLMLPCRSRWHTLRIMQTSYLSRRRRATMYDPPATALPATTALALQDWRVRTAQGQHSPDGVSQCSPP